uniref:GST N-terminal domain-containing protein n=1 Tax=Pseudictyota dubia TaxID=2749911 RepID=A0A7R9W8A9_9STRA|mmetsp:Transcript_38608/g.71364  ORF Transcript_38608/g.71364 Transcript_38608/m.71364 type:complete len:563 (+) Transcript_38608:32-1720(+)|eukprot:CAMPEP_0197438034 /NCGR_PEP_ID=MMETSP1175-20131217/5139_1 /TAXON_ID=1003142 /ORGANISM="Triceratium dubium, Strain CCMP147" /LENGTH=562 /DNA_ID=CAMNT_0042967685 /DNA_START=28 /DNA_END=1716 /DNA_ORIENTATION=+
MTNFSPLAVAALASSAAISFLFVAPATGVSAFTTCSAAASVPIRASAESASAASRLIAAGGSRSVSSTALSSQGKYNPLSMFGDMASSLLPGGGGDPNPQLDQTVASTVPSSWDDIRSILESVQTDEEKNFRTNVARGIGRASPLNKIRLFDETNSEKDIRVTFYRDHASWCPYCHKVWMCLEEKRIPYRVEKINMRCYGEKPPSFTRMQPSGAIPVAEIDGVVYNQSNDIIFALEQVFPDHKSLSPNNEQKRARAQKLLRLERQLFSAWMSWLTAGFGKDGFIQILNEVENELQASKGGDFFLGEDVSLVDFMFAPFIERMAASLLYFKGYQFRVANGASTDFPALNKWFDAMEKLESYQLTKSDYYTHCWDLPPQLGGCSYEKGGEPYENAINGERALDGSRGSWELPLEKDLGGIEPDWEWCGDEAAALREATERLSFNNANIVKFAARGAGKKGLPGYSAPLSDPNATPNKEVLASVDTVLRLVSLAMLNGAKSCDSDMAKLASSIKKEGGGDFAQDVINSLAYLRDRVGVPRDMRLPAARQLRAHLNWAINIILDAP